MTTLFKNNAASTLSSGLAIGATSMNLVVGDNFPVVVAPDVAYLTIENATNFEIVKVTARALGSNTPTIVRAQEGTTERAWLTGDVVSLRWTAAAAQSGANAQDVADAALTSHVVALDPHTQYVLDTELSAGLATKQSSGVILSALALLDASVGLVEQTGADTFTKRAIGSGANDIPTNTIVSAAVVIDGAFRSTQVFTASGTYTKPAGLKRVKVTVVGGGGGGLDSGGYCGGAGGGTGIDYVEAASVGATETVTIGAAGVANSSAGGTSSFGAHVSATGGALGVAGGTATGGIGSGGTINIAGGYSAAVYSPPGGSSTLGIGGTVGQAGRGYGGGGGPGNAAPTAAGSGSAGIVIVEEFF